MKQSSAHRTIDAIWRIESPKLIAGLTRMVRDVGLAEDLAQDALVIALEKWPISGIPDNPGAWLMTTAKRRAIDLLRRTKVRDRKYAEMAQNMDLYTEEDLNATLDGEIGDDLLRLIFMTCHPVLSQEARVALTLRLLCGLTTDEIARSFLAAEPTVAQRIVRAKKTLSAAKVPFEVPAGEALKERLTAVLEVMYLMFNEGYSATSGEDWIRPLLCREALRLGRVLAEIAPGEGEVHGLVALMEIQSSRFRTRIGAAGEPVLLMDQNRAQWDRLLIRRGLAALERSRKLGRPLGPYALQAAIAACHAEAPTAAETDWIRIAALYEALSRAAPSPIVELNRAVAVAMAFGPAFGLQIADELSGEPALKGYHLLPSVRGDLLVKLGRLEEARAEFERAASMTRNARERELLLNRAAECGTEAAE
ncbi:RNA polymerase subunit sigma-24 [Paenibacillus chitinolyticus]|uniref:RNA polymerase sigma factor n=1 Tax=Paenibacillus chitinolyticus TaxID=79263 RepID=A0A410WYN4_9BACL|nr:RNA polymerase sigma factor [Paenibacillus chitinolyticus]MCY9590478.1 RNA polymerase sigma factor [Paenibacillus chitinolyticus]MCY9596527.1 RNA polymerase sigma factor [Paenibacillus chitinolyticus]QAV19538.1 RNA polymerase subunit sigma-24 [Paenibacillus chitinolyticus]